jgi:DNA-binding NarL/FixJ family response regulator
VPVGEAGSAKQAVTKARALRPDVVLLDLVLPRGGGADVIPQLLQAGPAVRVVVVSSLAQPSAVRQVLAAGAKGYVSKRVSDTELVEAVRRVAAGERYLDPALGAQTVAREDSPALEPISERERDVLHLLAMGYTNQEIGSKLFVSVRTVDTHRAHIMQKLGLATRAELVLFALANGLIGQS